MPRESRNTPIGERLGNLGLGDKLRKVHEQPRALDSVTEEGIPETVESRPNVLDIPLDEILVGGVNVREIDDTDPDIAELADSIQSSGLLQPIRVAAELDGYRLIAGERRYRAVKMLGWPTITAVITDADEAQRVVEMVVENVQRKDLELWEEAEAYKRLLNLGLSLGEVAKRVGKAKSTLSVILKLTSRADIRAGLKSRAIPSWSMAKALNPLLDEDANEYEPGVMAEAIEYIRKNSPTVLEMSEWVRDRKARRSQPEEPPKKRQTSSFLTREADHFNDVRTRQLPKLSPPERQTLRQLLQEQIQYLDSLDSQDNA